jgi:hypothetical protein
MGSDGRLDPREANSRACSATLGYPLFSSTTRGRHHDAEATTMQILIVHNRHRSEMPSGESHVIKQEIDLQQTGHEVS